MFAWRPSAAWHGKAEPTRDASVIRGSCAD
jgi:hypothetical protein